MCILRPTFAHSLVVRDAKVLLFIFFLCVLSAHTQAACSECTKRKFIIEQKCIYLQLNLFAYKKKQQCNNNTCVHPQCADN